eukprot:TRINITY_DN30691_c0_g1_i1.p1 TRINITY_DN30691_c0_g1~~TRINITY_DN30691_c0_g1_i1.p1  ORF type:complete len:417 (+),score=57.34 TRINITY_DN30691_c0_g1_i1:314-1564(+)
MRISRIQWTEPGVCTALCWLIIDDRKGNNRRPCLLASLYSDVIAPFLHFDNPLPNQLYALGGRNQQDGPLALVEMYDTWHGQWLTCPNMSVRRAGCAAAVLPGGEMLVVGGYDESGIVKGLLASCEAFEPAAQRWDTDIPALERARWGHGCAMLGGLVYAVGGCSLRAGAPAREAFMETLRSCEVYDPIARTPWQPTAELHMARAGSRVVTIGDRYLAAVGGCDDVFGRAEMLPTVELFDSVACRWELLDVQLSTPRTTAAVAALDDRRILVIGGAPSLSSAEVYHVPDCSEGMDEDCFEASNFTAPQVISPPSFGENAVCDMAEGRMGCQAVALQLPAKQQRYPLCSRTCVAVVGGENGDEDWDYDQAHVRQFNSVLIYDSQEDEWRPEDSFPPMPTARTAMALCVGYGKISGYA